MDKKKNKFSQYRGYRESISCDQVSSLSDEEVRSHMERIHDEIERNRSRGGAYHHLEVDLCYFQREFQIREDRYHAHQAYVSRLLREDREEMQKELTLPEYKPDCPPRWWN
jgi:hypothetical protein